MCFKTVTNFITMYIIYIVFTRDKCLFRFKKPLKGVITI